MAEQGMIENGLHDIANQDTKKWNGPQPAKHEPSVHNINNFNKIQTIGYRSLYEVFPVTPQWSQFPNQNHTY